ncbi:MAG: NAD-dependent epimerase/dehydratase family protein [bacterium]|nr:NAD-dependent epimerase/dehydratase family protein [bacterium]
MADPILWITGVSGFSGRHLVTAMLAGPDRPQIVGLDLAPHGPPGVDRYERVDLTCPDEVASVAQSAPPRWVIHLAGAMPPAVEAQMWQANVGGTVGLLQGLASAGCRDTRVVTVGSAAEYRSLSDVPVTETAAGGGSSAYGRTKWIQTVTALHLGPTLGLSTMVVRPFNLLGPGLSTDLVAGWLVDRFARSAGRPEIPIGNTQSERDFVDIRDAVQAYWQVALRGDPGEIYNVCSGAATRIDQLLTWLSEWTGRSPRMKVDANRTRRSDPASVRGDYTKLERATGWRPVMGPADSLRDMLAAAPAAPAPQARQTARPGPQRQQTEPAGAAGSAPGGQRPA